MFDSLVSYSLVLHVIFKHIKFGHSLIFITFRLRFGSYKVMFLLGIDLIPFNKRYMYQSIIIRNSLTPHTCHTCHWYWSTNKTKVKQALICFIEARSGKKKRYEIT